MEIAFIVIKCIIKFLFREGLFEAKYKKVSWLHVRYDGLFYCNKILTNTTTFFILSLYLCGFNNKLA